MRKAVLFVVLSAFLIVPAVSMADDLTPPWWRGMPGTTSQIWEFMTPHPNPILPDGPATRGLPPLPSTMAWVYPGLGMGWLEWDMERQGVWQLSGSITVVVDNFNPPNREKWIQVQMTWRPQEGVPITEPIFDYFQPPPSAEYPPTLVDLKQLDFGWMHSTYAWRIGWNPPDETFAFRGNINLDELVVDTWCVPEPGTIVSLIGLALMIGIIFMRRK